MAKAATALWIALLAAYGTATAVYTARDTGDTVDEISYREAGLAYFRDLNFRINRDHPPLSKLIGAAYPLASGDTSIFAFRVGHAALYGVGGIAGSLLLLGTAGPWAGALFSVFYFLDPTLKSMAALDITDFDSALFAALAFLVVWASRRRSERLGARDLFISFCLLGLSCACKISGLILLPVLAWCIRSVPRPARAASWAAGGFVAALIASYLFDLPGLRWFGSALVFQFHHNTAGHSSFLFGKQSDHGFWYFYPASIACKLPLGSLAALLGSFVAGFVWRKRLRPERHALLVPALSFLVILSCMRVQTGIRYVLPSIVLLYAYAATVLAQVKHAPSWARVSAFAVLVACLGLADGNALKNGSYLSFFNVLAPEPLTRNFADSNIDWGQGIPAHLRAELPPFRYFEEALASPPTQYPARIAAGASSINGLAGAFYNSGRFLAAYDPERRVAGYEIFSLSEAQFREFRDKAAH